MTRKAALRCPNLANLWAPHGYQHCYAHVALSESEGFVSVGMEVNDPELPCLGTKPLPTWHCNRKGCPGTLQRPCAGLVEVQHGVHIHWTADVKGST